MSRADSSAASEGRALLTALADTAPDAATACEGWTAHDIAAHLAAGAKEVADLAEERLAGSPERATRGFDEREAPLRDLPHDQLLHELVEHNKRKLAAYAALAGTSEPDIAFTGTRLSVDELETHSRSEAAIHRWDLVGDDDASTALLSQPELTAHALKVLNVMPILNESARALGERALGSRPGTRVVLRSAGHFDVVFVADSTGSRFEIVEEGAAEGDARVTSDPAQRLLTLWGRRSVERPLETDGDPRLLTALNDIFWPHAQRWGQKA